ncbi:MAG: ABC transporter ATP-binding protein [Saprospiraceae bacterium]|nr:ABC transporter ATP-binding protein [Saprospiraceae bacterium]
MRLEIQELKKTYPNGKTALNGISLRMNTGMFGLLGPNGAGKSTLMRTLATLQVPDSGSIFFNDIDVLKDPMSLRRILGYLPQDFGVYPGLSAQELLEYLCVLKGIKSASNRKMIIEHVLDLTNLTEVRKQAVSRFSGGMKQRFGIAQLLLNNPGLIIVDEPTAGLDPVERKRFLNVLRQVGTESIVVFSSHIVEDISELCHQFAILNHGEILLKSSPSESIISLKGKIWERKIQPNEDFTLTPEILQLSSNYQPDNSIVLRLFASKPPDHLCTTIIPNLEDVYFLEMLRGNFAARNTSQ